MAKHKKKVLPDRVNQTKPKKDVKKNPFEVKLNRQKHQVIKVLLRMVKLVKYEERQ